MVYNANLYPVNEPIAALDPSNVVTPLNIDGSGNLKVTGGGGGGTQYTDGGTPPANPVAGAIMYDKGGTWTDVSVVDALPINVTNGNVNGQTTKSASSPVVIASDQTPVPIMVAVVAVYSLPSTTSTGATQNSGDLTVGLYREISIDINTTAQAGTAPTIQYFYERKAADGIYYVIWQSAVLTAAANTLSTSIGAGMAYNQSLGATGRLRWVVGGTATPTFTHSANIQGK